MDVNGIKDARRIRAGQMIKVPNGPFNAKLSKSSFRMDIYLQDVYVRSYMVGLGKDGGTPTGQWKVQNKLSNPTYYPPASADGKRIVAPNDPKNPLGEHWIGLEGISGRARLGNLEQFDASIQTLHPAGQSNASGKSFAHLKAQQLCGVGAIDGKGRTR